MIATRNLTRILLAATLTIWSCGNETDTVKEQGETKTTEESTSEISTATVSFSGSVTMAPVEQATVEIYKLNDDGSRGDLLASVETNKSGEYTIEYNYEGAIEVVAKGGAYEDEATGETVEREEGEEIRTLLPSPDSDHVGINALTTIAAINAIEKASKGLEIALAAANQEVASMFGLEGVDFVKTKPDDLTNIETEIEEGSNESKLGLVMAGISQMAKDNGLLPGELGEMIRGISEDFSDGAFDGKMNGEELSVALGVTPEQAMSGLSKALNNFAAGARNAAGFSADDIPSMPELQREIPKTDENEAETESPQQNLDSADQPRQL